MSDKADVAVIEVDALFNTACSRLRTVNGSERYFVNVSFGSRSEKNADCPVGVGSAVIGNLRGLAHAGAKGNKDAVIAASSLDVVQIRISNIVREIDREEESVIDHAFIYVDEDKIVIE